MAFTECKSDFILFCLDSVPLPALSMDNHKSCACPISPLRGEPSVSYNIHMIEINVLISLGIIIWVIVFQVQKRLWLYMSNVNNVQNPCQHYHRIVNLRQVVAAQSIPDILWNVILNIAIAIVNPFKGELQHKCAHKKLKLKSQIDRTLACINIDSNSNC